MDFKAMIRMIVGDEADQHKFSFAAQLEEVLQKWKQSNQKLFESPAWNKFDAKLQFGGCELIMTRYWISEISEERDVSDTDDEGDTIETYEIPKAWLERRSKSEMFPWDEDFYIRSYYGLEDFIVIYYSNEAFCYTTVDELLDIISIAVNKTGCQIPLFAQFEDGLDIQDYTYNVRPRRDTDDLETREGLSVVEVSTWSNYFFHEPGNQLLNVDSTTDFKIENCSDHPNYPRNRFDLYAYWSDLQESEAIDNKGFKKLDLLEAHKWSVQIKLVDEAEDLWGDCLKEFLLELSSTQTESLFNHPQLASLLKYRRVYPQRKEVDAVQGLKPEFRKVTSKLSPESEESFIPDESLDTMLDFLFSDEELKTSQHSKGGNSSTTTTAKDEVEEEFLSYKELKCFKSAQPPAQSITWRLAVCLCIVNKYHGGMEAVNQLWAEFVLEMKHRLENNYEINGLEPIEPNFDYTELLNKLQVLNDCIEKRKARDASSATTSTTFKNITETSGEDIIDISELPADEKSIDLSESSVSTSTNRALLRVQKLFDHSLAMNAFKRANPGCAIGDLVRWCLTEDLTEEMVTEGRDKATNEVYLNKRIKISESLSMVFHNDQIPRRFPDDDDADKVLHWLASVEPSDLVFGLMPVLIHSVITKLLKHPASKLHQNFFHDHLIQIKDDLAQCNSQDWFKNIEDAIDNLTLIADKMSKVQYLLKKFRYFDPTISVSDQELEGFVFELVEFSNASIPTPKAELPSHTNLGKIIYKFFLTGHEVENLPLDTEGSHNVCKLKYSGVPYHTCYHRDVLTTCFDEYEFRISGPNTCTVSNKETAS